MQHLIVLGAGFAGLWSAVAAAKALDERGIGPEEVAVTVVNATPWHSIRVRNYEADLSGTRVPLADILQPIGVHLVVADVSDLNVGERTVTCDRGGQIVLSLATTAWFLPLAADWSGRRSRGFGSTRFDVDTYEAASRLGQHLAELAGRPRSPGRDTVLVIGAGLTGIEVAAEMPGRLRSILGDDQQARPRVILADRASRIGSDMGDSAEPVIAQALAALGVETRPRTSGCRNRSGWRDPCQW